MGFEYDLTNVDESGMEAVDSGGKVPVGWYKAKLDDYYPDAKNEGRHVFDVVVAGGAFDGKHLFYSFFDPSGADDLQKQKRALERILALGARLGLIQAGTKGEIEFANAIGADLVVRVVENKRESGTFTEIGYLDVYPPDHHTIPADVRTKLQLPAARPKGSAPAPAAVGAGAAPSANGPPKGQWDDL